MLSVLVKQWLNQNRNHDHLQHTLSPPLPLPPHPSPHLYFSGSARVTEYTHSTVILIVRAETWCEYLWALHQSPGPTRPHMNGSHSHRPGPRSEGVLQLRVRTQRLWNHSEMFWQNTSEHEQKFCDTHAHTSTHTRAHGKYLDGLGGVDLDLVGHGGGLVHVGTPSVSESSSEWVRAADSRCSNLSTATTKSLHSAPLSPTLLSSFLAAVTFRSLWLKRVTAPVLYSLVSTCTGTRPGVCASTGTPLHRWQSASSTGFVCLFLKKETQNLYLLFEKT